MAVSLETFAAAVNRFAELQREGRARLVIGADGSTLIAVDPLATDVPAPGGGLLYDVFDVLTAIANNATIEEFVQQRKQQPGADEDAILRGKYEAAAAVFPPETLRKRAWLRHTSKVPVLAAIEWEAVLKERDSRMPPVRAAFGQLKLTTQTVHAQPQEVVLGLDAADVEELLTQLGRLRDALAELDDVRTGERDDGPSTQATD
jgi:hypothetical protein